MNAIGTKVSITSQRKIVAVSSHDLFVFRTNPPRSLEVGRSSSDVWVCETRSYALADGNGLRSVVTC